MEGHFLSHNIDNLLYFYYNGTSDQAITASRQLREKQGENQNVGLTFVPDWEQKYAC